jgi:hypothetical protein
VSSKTARATQRNPVLKKPKPKPKPKKKKKNKKKKQTKKGEEPRTRGRQNLEKRLWDDAER